MPVNDRSGRFSREIVTNGFNQVALDQHTLSGDRLITGPIPDADIADENLVCDLSVFFCSSG